MMPPKTITVGAVRDLKLSRDGRTMAISIPISIRRTGGRKKFVTPANAAPWSPPPARVDSTIVKALARAHRWRGMLESNLFATVRDLSKAEKINEAYLCRVLRLTLLSPRVAEAILGELASEGRCAIVLDDGFLFRKDETAFVETKRKLVDECDLWAIISLPAGCFSGAGAAVKTNLLFFTRGKKTSKIWYYDLTHVKVGKKSPMTLAHFGFGKDGEVLEDSDLPALLTEAWREDETSIGDFPSYARLLSVRGTPEADSRYSWTIDFAARPKQAREEMTPHLAEAEATKAEVVALKEKLKAFKATNHKDERSEALEKRIDKLERAVREAQSKADAIDASVFDLKAVNPNAVVRIDTRTPEEVIASIADQSKLVSQALESLRNLLGLPLTIETGS